MTEQRRSELRDYVNAAGVTGNGKCLMLPEEVRDMLEEIDKLRAACLVAVKDRAFVDPITRQLNKALGREPTA